MTVVGGVVVVAAVLLQTMEKTPALSQRPATARPP